MNFDIVFQDAVATADLTSLLKILEDHPKVDTQSDSFREVIELSIRNGEDAVFAKLLRHLPKLTLRARSQPVQQSRRHQIRQALWTIARQLTFEIATGVFFILLYYHALSFILWNTMRFCSGRARKANVWCYDHLHSRPRPFSLWVCFLSFCGIEARFSRKFLLDSLDKGLVFLGLNLAARSVSPSTWIGKCIHEALSSLISFRGICTREILLQCMPRWRRMYFSIVLGPDHALAAQVTSTPSLPGRDYSESVLSWLLRCKCKAEAVMLQYLDIVAFENINESCGAGHEIFIWAAENGYVRVVRNLLDLGIDANIDVSDADEFRFRGPPSGSALFWAAIGGHTDVVEMLLRDGAEVKEDNPDHSPLIGATKYSHREYAEKAMQPYSECVAQLLIAGANPNAVDRQGRSALSWCTQPTQKPLLDLLLDSGADPDASDQEWKLPLHYAARFSYSQDVVQTLLAKTSNPNSVDREGTSSLTWALWSADCPPTIEHLLDLVSDIDLGGGKYGCPLQAASRYCSSTIVKMLLDKGADPNVIGGDYGSCLAALLHRPFNTVVFQDDLLCLELLLSSGADPNRRMKNGKQALHVAASICYHSEIFEMLLRHGADVNAAFDSHEGGYEAKTTPLGIVCNHSVGQEAAMALLKAGANPNCSTPFQRTPLHSACDILGSSKVALELVKRGADVRARSTVDDTTPLHRAATAARSDIVKELIERGADVDAQDERLRTPLHNACRRTPDSHTQQEEIENPFETRLHQYGMKMTSKLQQSIELLLELGQGNPKARDNEGATPLHYAVKAGNATSVKTLVSLASNDLVFEQDNHGKLPLHWAADAGFTSGLGSLIGFYPARRPDDSDKARPEWDMQRYVNAQDNSGNTALHYAAQNGHENSVATLLSGQMRADINIRNHAGQTALDLAKENHQVWVVAQLKDAEGNREVP